jgi:hypothetical protein
MKLPAYPTIAVYKLGDAEPFFHIYSDGFGPIRWWEKQIILADYFGCSVDDVASREDADGRELIFIDDKVVGSFDFPVNQMEATR